MRAFNFSAGPAMLPEEVMRKAQTEFLDWKNTGMSVMEVSHRSKEFMELAHKMEADLREVMHIPDNYKVLFVHGGASLQFTAIPMNLTQEGDTVDYINTGVWSAKAIKEASRYVNVNEVATSETSIPSFDDISFSKDAKYIHICQNETITGVEYQSLPKTDKIIVADFSSTILSRPINVSDFGVIYAGAQKNIGPAGLAIVIVREDLIGNARSDTPTLMNWQTYNDNESMFNTPSTYAWYLASLVFEWIKDQGGVEKMAEINQRKANKLYELVDASDFYYNEIEPSVRSWMNVTFKLKNPDLDTLFLEESKKAGLLSLKGHKVYGGMRASIYNAMPEAGIDALVAFMKDFEEKHA
ncbi:3-phosphoserine/phosphohydroxythreonine transaminase [Hydrogenovibrio sp. JE_KL2]|uniref:3-phosphoserine/phosphohydroxythreonine transaminase n=1 Tax=Hydrogenovibrio sp. JE_KL2 TaxID=2651188 RepID=UPI00128B5F64|nr:3-phosphoserine/phosphohydroxythreonine transaminase [Hydrogenovibrio sp. JE_KL2]MPQ75987.1 3-phosphoserine/phosphohydroxythreonine transaminase [Hydrogenovibrio sp. JE_KL2]